MCLSRRPRLDEHLFLCRFYRTGQRTSLEKIRKTSVLSVVATLKLMIPAAAETAAFQAKIRTQLVDRRFRLQSALSARDRPSDLVRLLTEVDSALSRLGGNNYGLCDVCQLPIDKSDLLANPLASYCLCKMNAEQQKALERDLDLAWRVQAALLPPLDLTISGWQTYYRYLPHGIVSGDYCDLIIADGDHDQEMYFMLGDVSGKGVAASLLMAHLNACLRSLAHSGLSPRDMIGKTDRLLAESSLPSHYVTLICGRAGISGQIEVINAGHCAPILIRGGGSAEVLEAAGLPLGLAIDTAESDYPDERVILHEGDTLVLHTDGITEARDSDDQEYGRERLLAVLRSHCRDTPRELIAACLSDLASFMGAEERTDDLTILAVARR